MAGVVERSADPDEREKAPAGDYDGLNERVRTHETSVPTPCSLRTRTSAVRYVTEGTPSLWDAAMVTASLANRAEERAECLVSLGHAQVLGGEAACEYRHVVSETRICEETL